MMNIVRADLYAILRGKAVYITFGVVMLLHFLTIGTGTMGGINFGGSDANPLEMPDGFDFSFIGSAEFLYTRTDNMIFPLLPLIIAASAAIFTFGTVKNDLAWGIPRSKLYLSKLTTSIGLCILLLLFYMISGMLFAWAINSFGGPIPDRYWINLFQTVGAQLFMMISLACFGTFLMFMTKSTAATTGIYIAFLFIPSTIIFILLDSGFNVARLLNFDIWIGINRLGFFSQLDRNSILTILGVGLFYIIASTTFGIVLFRRAEIK